MYHQNVITDYSLLIRFAVERKGLSYGKGMGVIIIRNVGVKTEREWVLIINQLWGIEERKGAIIINKFGGYRRKGRDTDYYPILGYIRKHKKGKVIFIIKYL